MITLFKNVPQSGLQKNMAFRVQRYGATVSLLKKSSGHRNSKKRYVQSDQSEHSAKTAERLAKEYGVSSRMIRRDGKFAEEVAHGGDRISSDQNEHMIQERTAERLARIFPEVLRSFCRFLFQNTTAWAFTLAYARECFRKPFERLAVRLSSLYGVNPFCEFCESPTRARMLDETLRSFCDALALRTRSRRSKRMVYP